MKSFLTLMLAVAIFAVSNPAHGQQVVPQPEINVSFVNHYTFCVKAILLPLQESGFSGRVVAEWGKDSANLNQDPKVYTFDSQTTGSLSIWYDFLDANTMYYTRITVEVQDSSGALDTTFVKMLSQKTLADPTGIASTKAGVVSITANPEMDPASCVVHCPEGYHIMMYSVIGQAVQETKATADVSVLRLEDGQPNGVYIVQVLSNGKPVATKKVILHN